MVKFIFILLVTTLLSLASANNEEQNSIANHHTYNVDDPNFWVGWKRDTYIETSIFQMIKKERLTVRQLTEKADKLNPEYAFYVGLLYYIGNQSYDGATFTRNQLKALDYFNTAKSAQYLMPYINYYIGMILWNGYDGVTKNKAGAKQHLSASGTPESFLVLAAISFDNPSEQLNWYRQLAYTGEWRAILTVAHWYKIGRGTPKNIGEAYYWYSKACSEKIKFACEQLKSFNL